MIKQLIQQIGQEMNLCPICCTNVEQMYSISNCSHKCCEQCMIEHIRARLQNFSDLKCINSECKKTFSQKSPIALKLPEEVLKKYRKYLNYKYLSNNPHLRQCKNGSCEGVMNRSRKEKRCPSCRAKHCSKCYQLKHEGNCNVEHDILMMNLNYRRCPKCRVWVEKSGGCQYLGCKCGMLFCFNCGVQFKYDPCRKDQIREQEGEIKTILANLEMPEVGSCLGKICSLPKLFFQLILFILLTSVGCTLAIGFTFGILLPLFIGLSPLIIFFIWRESTSKKQCCEKSCVAVLCSILLFYPVISAFVLLVTIGILLSYPIGRKLYPTRIYDSIDVMLTYSALYYLRAVKAIVQF